MAVATAPRISPTKTRDRFGRTFAGWLVVGWCAISALWISAAATRIPLCQYGQAGCFRGALLSRTEIAYAVAVAVAGAVALLVLWWWIRGREPELAAAPVLAPGRRRLSGWVLLAVAFAGVVSAAHLLLFAPASDHPFCAVTARPGSAMAYPLNCDSTLFMHMAHHPRQILDAQNPRQSRPGYVAAAAVATRLVGPVAGHLGLDRLYDQSDSAYFPLVLLNFLLAAAAIALLARLLLRLDTPPWAVAGICGLMAVNDVVKAFYWSPHQQMFALLTPVLTIILGRWVILRRPPWWQLSLAGLGVGLGALVYGSFLITVGVVVLILLGGSIRGGLRGGARGLARAAVFGATFAVPSLIWIEICRRVAGSYYNQESQTYHEFVWLPQAARGGLHQLARWVATMSITTIRELVSACGLALVLFWALGAVAVQARIPLRPESAEQRATLISAALTVAVSIAFAWAIGLMATRLMFHAVPGILVGIGWLAGRLSGRSRQLGTAVSGAVWVVLAGVVVVALTTAGPYS